MPKRRAQKNRQKQGRKRGKNNTLALHSNFGVFDTKSFIFNDLLFIPFPSGVGSNTDLAV
jgi:hypothetical protein